MNETSVDFGHAEVGSVVATSIQQPLNDSDLHIYRRFRL